LIGFVKRSWLTSAEEEGNRLFFFLLMNKYISNEKMTLEEGQKKRKCLIFSLFSFKNKKKMT